MRLSSWLEGLCARCLPRHFRKPVRQHRKSARAGVHIEALESKTYLSAVSWDGGGDGTHWGDPLNWSADTLPGTDDDVTINFGAATILHNTGDDTIHSLTAMNKVAMSGGTLTINSASVFNNEFAFSNGVLNGSGDITLNATLQWSGGTMGGTGHTIVPANVVMNLNGSNFKQLNRVLENNGTANWTFGGWQFNGGTFENNGTLNIDSPNPLGATGTGGTNVVENSGTIVKKGFGASAFSTTTTGVVVNNSGTVDVQQGNLAFSSGGTHDGNFHVATGTTLEVGGVQSFAAGVEVTGAGTFNIAQFSVTTLNGNDIEPFVNVTGKLQVDGASSIDSAVMVGTLSGSGDLTLTGNVTWNSVKMEGTGRTIVDSTAAISVNSAFLSRLLINNGTVKWTGGQFRFNGGTFQNNGTFIFDPILNLGGLVVSDGGTNAFQNAGTFINKNAGFTQFHSSGTGVAFNNTGIVEIQSGTLVLGSPGSGTGPFQIDVGATLQLAARQAWNGAVISGDGSLEVINVGTAADPQTLEVAATDVGAVATGFNRNTVLGRMFLNNSYVRLIDNSDDAPGTAAEALYVNNLRLTGSATLDLNQLHAYTRLSDIAGTITGGSLGIVADGGTIVPNLPTPGSISAAGETDEWTFYGRVGDAVTVQVNPGTLAQPAPPAPTLDFAQITLIDPDGNVVGTAASATSGQVASLLAVDLTKEGTYRVQVTAAPGHSSNKGNYVLAVFDATIETRPLVLNLPTTGLLESQFSTDQWTFSANGGQQVQFHLLAAASAGIRFRLTGPNGFVGFTDLNTDSGFVTLPTTGTYTLQAIGNLTGFGAYTFRMDLTGQTPLNLGATFSGSMSGSGFAQLFRVEVPDGSPLLIQFDDTTNTDKTEVYGRIGLPPTRQTFDARFSTNGADHDVLVPFAAPGTWYVLVYADDVPTPSSFTLLVDAEDLAVVSVTPATGVVGQQSQVTITGLGFLPGTQFDLVPVGGGVTIPAQQVSIDSTTQATVTFNLAGAALGNYDVRATMPGGPSQSLAGVFQVAAEGLGAFEFQAILPGNLGRHAFATLYVEYANTGNVPIDAPILTLYSNDPDNSDRPLLTLDQSLVASGLWTPGLAEGFSSSVQIYATGATPGVVLPGERIRVPVYYAGLQQPWDLGDTAIEFELGIHVAGDTTPIDWPSLEASLRPDWIAPDVWPAVFANLQAQIGSTWGDYVDMLADNASYLGRLGEHLTSIDELYEFEVRQALGIDPIGTLVSALDAAVPTPGLSLDFERSFGNTITERSQVGPFGKGWNAPWQISLETLADGTVIVHESADSQRRFQPDSRHAGTYFSQAGDTGSLVAVSGGFELTEASGLKTRFLADGKLNFVRDINGNQITAGFTGNRLTSLTHSAGGSILITYNAAGVISSITDSAGHSTSYTYDASNTHLLSATGPAGTTTYTYATGMGAQRENALLTVTGPDGIVAHFDYDEQGRISASYVNNNVERVDYTYDSTGTVTITNASGTTGKVFFDHRGLILRSEDGAGNYVVNEYNDDLQLIKSTDSLGRVTSFTRCDCGRPKTITDTYGRTILTFTLGGPNNAPTAFTDANGNLTQYTYDTAGNLTRTTYADGTFEQATYDAQGNLDVMTNRRGATVDRTVNASGQVTHEEWSDGTIIDYTYDARGRQHTAIDPHGTTTLTYDTADRLTRIDYPAGRWLQYTYDAAGRRTQLLDYTGFATNYEYDAVGRLIRLRDAANAIIDEYTYDAAGRLSREDKGNGTYTVYGYDNVGRQISVINHAPDNSVNSQFLYTYDAAGRRDSQTTSDGVWSYEYDLVDQLTHAVFVSSNIAIPNQDLTYEYDDLGNRTRTILNGATANYAANNMNQYTSAGGTTFVYDSDGNLIEENGPGGLKQYTYDQLNRLTHVQTAGGSWDYEYDVLGNRSAVVENGVRTEYLIDPTGLGDVIGEYDAGGIRVTGYAHGLGLEASTTTGGIGYFDFDALGSTSGISTVAGDYVDQYAYDPWGNSLLKTETVANPFEFVGQFGVMTDNSGLTFMRARFYSSTNARFVSQDPLRLGGGQPNFYTYVGNGPLNAIDPTGLLSCSDLSDAELYALIRFSEEEIAAGQKKEDYYTYQEEDGHHTKLYDYSDRIKRLREQIQEYREELRLSKCTKPGIHPQPVPIPYPPITPCKPAFGDEIDGTVKFSSKCPPDTDVPSAVDPNEKLGAGGFGEEGFIQADTVIPYRINFENLGPGSVPTPAQPATAPAQRVEVTDQLPTTLDWDTLQFTEFGFGDLLVTVPAGQSNHFETVAITYNNQRFDVQVELTFDSNTGLVRAVFQSLDHDTMLPPDVLTGFLPPEDGTGIGQAHFSYIIHPKAGLASGTELRNVALISFDGQTEIATNQVDPQNPAAGTDPNKEALNTIDAAGPTSSVTALPATSPATFTVNWSGTDDENGSGIESYLIYVSDNGGDFVLFQDETTATSAQFTGVVGHTYAFYSVAIDNVGHVESAPASADTQTLTEAPANQSPSILDALFSLPENSPLNSPVGTPAASDPDAGDILTYSITEGNASGAFAINSATGAITVANSAALDFETTSSFALTVQVADDHGATDTATVTINLTDVDENQPPVISDVVFTLAENSPLNTAVGTPVASDPDVADILTYSISAGNTSGAFAINPTTGAITVANTAALDFETTPAFTLTVQVADNHGATDTATVIVNLTDVVENVPPQLNLNGSAVTWTKKQPPVVVLPQITVGGPSNFEGGTLTINVNAVGTAKKLLDILHTPSFSGFGSSQGPLFTNGHLILQIQLNAGATDATIQSFLRTTTFATKGKGLKTPTRSVQITLANSAGASSSITQIVNVKKK